MNKADLVQVKFKTWNCFAIGGKYRNGRKGIRLYDYDGGEPVASATVNLVDHKLPEGYVHIKNYSENEGMTESLVEAGIVDKPVNSFDCGWPGIKVDTCKILDESLWK